MKFKFLVLLLPCFCISTLYGQKGILIKAGSYQSNLIVLDGDYRYGKPSVINNPGAYFGISFYKEKHPIMQWEYTFIHITKGCYIDIKDGGLGGWGNLKYNYKLHYFDASVYPVFHFGNEIKISGASFFELAYLYNSTYEGTSTYQNMYMPQSKTENVSGNASDNFRNFCLSVFYMARVEFVANKNYSFFIECKYSSSLFNVTRFYPKFKAHDFSIGAGLKIAF